MPSLNIYIRKEDAEIFAKWKKILASRRETISEVLAYVARLAVEQDAQVKAGRRAARQG